MIAHLLKIINSLKRKKMKYDTFSIMEEGVLVTGEIIDREKYFLKIRIVSPFMNWENQVVIKGPGRQSPRHYLTEYGDKRARDLLLESYRKLKIIDESLDRIVGVYKMLEEEITEVSLLEDSEIKTRIVSKLNAWFFGKFIFTSSVTGLITGINEEEKIKQIITVYRDEKKRIYL